MSSSAKVKILIFFSMTMISVSLVAYSDCFFFFPALPQWIFHSFPVLMTPLAVTLILRSWVRDHSGRLNGELPFVTSYLESYGKKTSFLKGNSPLSPLSWWRVTVRVTVNKVDNMVYKVFFRI